MPRKLTERQRSVLEVLAQSDTVIRHGDDVWTGTRYRINGTGTAYPARTLWSLVDSGLLEYGNAASGYGFRVTDAGRSALEGER